MIANTLSAGRKSVETQTIRQSYTCTSYLYRTKDRRANLLRSLSTNPNSSEAYGQSRTVPRSESRTRTDHQLGFRTYFPREHALLARQRRTWLWYYYFNGSALTVFLVALFLSKLIYRLEARGNTICMVLCISSGHTNYSVYVAMFPVLSIM
jgi:hypothetical protein